jgi:thiamine pyrophosphate-dependent acetolactate synthase large subunit-like protein
MYRESIIMHYTIICTSNGYMVEQEEEDGGNDYVHTKSGDNTFTTYAEACGVLANHLIGIKNEQTN